MVKIAAKKEMRRMPSVRYRRRPISQNTGCNKFYIFSMYFGAAGY